MRTLTYLTLDKRVRQLRRADVDAFATRISGGVLTAADSGHDEARKVWNGTVDRRPALIARYLNVNFLTEDEAERVAASYGTNYPRLQIAKRRYDPENLFRMNLNIAPASASTEQHRPIAASATLPNPAE